MASGSAKGGTSAGTKETGAARRSRILQRANSGGTQFQTSDPSAANYSPF